MLVKAALPFLAVGKRNYKHWRSSVTAEEVQQLECSKKTVDYPKLFFSSTFNQGVSQRSSGNETGRSQA
ncbi:MAG: hypothetical protein M0Z71_09990 [Nitrospiraceae bacterium]|nr:hypothetical protein [Nitrospiraceae bacterium]